MSVISIGVAHRGSLVAGVKFFEKVSIQRLSSVYPLHKNSEKSVYSGIQV